MALVAARLNAESFSVVVTELVKCKIKFSGSKKFSRVVILIGIVSFFYVTVNVKMFIFVVGPRRHGFS